MKRRIGTYFAGACVVGLVAGVPAAATLDTAVANGLSSGKIAATSWTASENMVVCLYGPPSMFGGQGGSDDPVVEPISVIDEPISVLYGPPPVFDDRKDNPLKVNVANKTVAAKKLVASKRVFKRAIVVKRAKGDVSFTRLKKGSSKALNVEKRTGAITVAKGTKAGDYAIRVKVKAKGNKSYKPDSTTVTVKVRVK